MSVLKSVFTDLGEQDEKKILGLAARKEYSEGEKIVEEGTPGRRFYVIESGRVLISKKIEGKEDKALAILEQGDFFGEMSLLDGGPHSANAKALEKFRVLAIERGAFEGMLRTDYETASRLLFFLIKIMSERLRSSTEELVALYETGRTIGSSRDLKELLSGTLNALLNATGSNCAAFILHNQFSQGYAVKESAGISDVENGLVESVMKETVGRIVNDAAAEGLSGKIKSEPEILSMIASPIKLGSRDIGLIILGKKKAGGYRNKNLTMLSAVAGQIAAAVENMFYREEDDARKKLGQVYIKF